MNPKEAAIRIDSTVGFENATARVYQVEGKMIAVFRREENHFVAVEERCPHRAGPLSEGKWENGKIICPWHGSEFNSQDGAVLKGPARRCIATHQVLIEGDDLLLLLNREAKT